MNDKDQNLFGIFDQILSRKDKEKQLEQRAVVVWLTGLSGSGKSTIATALERKLYENNFVTMLLDGDNVRLGINNNLSFSEEDRIENVRRVAEICKLFINCGIITIASFVSPTREIRKVAREIIGEEDFLEIYVNTPVEVCEQRDVKGLYKKARAGKIANFTGINAPFEAPVQASLELKTQGRSIEETATELYNFLNPKIQF